MASVNLWLAAAALAALATCVAHVVIGGRLFARPLLSAELRASVKHTTYFCWHLVTAAIALMAGALAWAALAPAARAAAYVATALAGAFVAVNVTQNIAQRLSFARHPQGGFSSSSLPSLSWGWRMAKPKPRPKSRFGREDWIELGLTLLSKHGPEALTVERLTEAARKTRGSFYHHFEDHPAFLAALGARWREHSTEAPIAQADAALKAGKRRDALARSTAEIDHALERNIRRLAASEPAVAREVARTDQLRIDYLARLFRSELGLSAEDALQRARIQHSYFVGAQMVFPDADARFRLALQKTLGATLWRK